MNYYVYFNIPKGDTRYSGLRFKDIYSEILFSPDMKLDEHDGDFFEGSRDELIHAVRTNQTFCREQQGITVDQFIHDISNDFMVIYVKKQPSLTSPEPAAEPAPEPAPEPEPACKLAFKPAAEPAPEPAAEPAAEPSAKPASKPAAKPAAEPEENTILGAYAILLNHRSLDELHVDGLCVPEPKNKKDKGVGTLLLNKIKRFASLAGKKKITLWARSCVKGFYERNGFTEKPPSESDEEDETDLYTMVFNVNKSHGALRRKKTKRKPKRKLRVKSRFTERIKL